MGVVSVWSGSHPAAGSDALLVNFAFVSLAHLLYMASVISSARTRKRAGNAIAWAGLSVNALAYSSWILAFLGDGFSQMVAGFALLGVAAVYLVLATLAVRRRWADRQTVNILLVFALAFLAVASAHLFGLARCTATWSILAIATAEAEKRTGEKVLGALSYLILIAAGLLAVFHVAPLCYQCALCVAHPATEAYAPSLVLRIVRLGALPVAMACVGVQKGLKPLALGAAGVVFAAYSAEAILVGRAFLPSIGSGSLTLAWTLAAFAGVWLGIRRCAGALRIAALVLLGVAVAKLLVFDTARLPTPGRVGIFALVGGLLLVGAFLYLKYKERFEIHD